VEFYSYNLDDFRKKRPKWEFMFFRLLDEQNLFFTNDLIRRIRSNDKLGRKTVVVLPVGPINYRYFVDLTNTENISLKNLVIFFMDEYSGADGNFVSKDHPLSFRRFVEDNFYNLINYKNRMPEEFIIFPNGHNPSETIAKINSFEGIDVTYGGFGINGHLAFNDPPEETHELTEENVRFSTVRTVTLPRETIVQNAMGGTGGNMDIIPRHAVTLGMKELLSAKEIHLYLIRTWHAGIMRKALFGPIDPRCPGSYVQFHNKVRVCMTPEVVALPKINVTLNIGT